MRKLQPILAAAAFLACANAAATVVAYGFHMTVDELWEYNGSTRQIAYVNSSTMPGVLFSVGDEATGSIQYSTDMPLSAYQPPPQSSGSYRIYSAGVHSALSFNTEKWNFQSNSDPWQSIIQVGDNASSFSGSDVLSITTSAAWSPISSQTMTINLFDSTGTALDDSILLTAIDFSRFGYLHLDYGWLRQSDGSQLHAAGRLYGFSEQGAPKDNSVPVPGTLFDVVAGAIGWVCAVGTGVARRRGQTNVAARSNEPDEVDYVLRKKEILEC